MDEDLGLVNPEEEGSDQEENYKDDSKHAQLLDAISALDGKKRHSSAPRSLPASQISEYNFRSGGGTGKVKLHELVGTLREETSHGTLKKQLNSVERRAKVVPTPLPKPEQERIQRSLAYETTTTEVSKWDSIVQKNRKADQLQFPLQRPDLKVITTTDKFVKRFQARTPLEIEVAALLKGSKSVPVKSRELTAAEEKALQAMSVEEAEMRRSELQKYRALLSYKEAKARWQKRIKSKRYHKHMRKSRQKEELKAIEELKKNDPEAYMEKMKQIEKERIEERMNLKHRGGSKFIQKQKIYSKFQDQARQAIQDMYQKSRELTQKRNLENDSDQESGVSMDSEDEMKIMESDIKGNNPWMSMNPGKKIKLKSFEDIEKEKMQTEIKLETDITNEKNESVTYDNPQTNNDNNGNQENSGSEDKTENLEDIFDKLDEKILKNTKLTENLPKKRKKNRKTSAKKSNTKVKKDESDEKLEEEEIIEETLTKKTQLEDFEDKEEDIDNSNSPSKSVVSMNDNEGHRSGASEVYIDPKKLFTIGTEIKSTSLPDVIVNDDGEDVSNVDQRMTIAEAFADDDVVEEFTQEKAEVKQKGEPKDIDLTLPGWGEWAGSGIKPSKKKKKRFIIKAPPGPPRKDRLLGHVIINEKKDDAIAKHQVSHLPFPYTNVKQFEKTVKTPVGKTWNPETSFKLLTKPKVVTRLGTVINPINKSEVFKKEQPSNRKNSEIKFNDGQQSKKKTNRKKQMKKKVKRL